MRNRQEHWRPIEGYEGVYEVSDCGRVRSLDHYVKCNSGERLSRGKLLKLQSSVDGYKCVHLCHEGREIRIRVHQYVLSTFVGEKPFEDAQVNHKDGDKTNNHVENLEWCDASQNKLHAIRLGLVDMEKLHTKRRGMKPWNYNPQTNCADCKLPIRVRARGLCSSCYQQNKVKGTLSKFGLFQDALISVHQSLHADR